MSPCPTWPLLSCHCPAWLLEGMIWGTGTSAGGPAMPAAPGGVGGWHLPPTCPGTDPAPCSLSGQLCWLPTCQMASPVPGWGCWLCPGQGHPSGCQRGRDTEAPGDMLRASVHPWCCSPGPVGCALCLFLCPAPLSLFPIPCSPFPAPHSLLSFPCSPFPAPHACTTFLLPVLCSLCLLPVPCSPFPAPHASPSPAALPGAHRSHGQGQQGCGEGVSSV